jgi:Clr5 domain
MRPSIDLQRFRDELEQLYLTHGYTHQQLADWLANQGLAIAPRTLKRRLKDWGLTRRKAAGTSTALETISDLFQLRSTRVQTHERVYYHRRCGRPHAASCQGGLLASLESPGNFQPVRLRESWSPWAQARTPPKRP